MKTSHLPATIRRRVKRAARKLRRPVRIGTVTKRRTAKRELRTLAEHLPRFRPEGWFVL